MCLNFVAPLPFFSVLLGNGVSVPVCAAEEVRKRGKGGSEWGILAAVMHGERHC